MAKAKKKTPAKKSPAKKKASPKNAVAKAPAKKKAVKKPIAQKKSAPATKAPAKKSPVKKKPAAKSKAVSKSKAKPAAKKKAMVKAKTKPATKNKAVIKPAAKKVAPKKKVAVKKAIPAKKISVKKAAAKKAAPVKAVKPVKKTTAKKATGTAPAKTKQSAISMAKSTKKVSLRKGAISRKPAAKPIAFSLDEVRSIAKTASKAAPKTKKVAGKADKAVVPAKKVIVDLPPAKPSHVAAASLADILGFAPGKTKRPNFAPAGKKVPEKFKRFHKLLIDLRTHLTEGIELHSEETLKRSAKDDAGDLSSYGQHMADAGTDTFDRDFALSLVSSEQEALSEIEAAINRIYDGTYGVCEITGKAIAKERLGAVPFTRYSTVAQKDLERNRHHKRTQAGLFGEHDDAGKMMDADGDGD